MASYAGSTAKYTRSARFTPRELAVISELKAKHRQQQTTPPNLYRVGEKFWLPNGAWKLKSVVGGYMTLEKLDALGKAIQEKRSARVIEISEGAFMAHVRRNREFLDKVNAATDLHWADVLAAKKSLSFDLKVALAHKIHWADCHPKETKAELAKRAQELIHASADYKIGDRLTIRYERTGTILRRLTDGRYVVRINEVPFLAWDYYTQDELRALNADAARRAA